MKQQLLDSLTVEKSSVFLEIPQNGFVDLANRFGSGNFLPDLPKLQEHIRRSRKAVRSKREIDLAILNSCRTPNVQHWIMVKARLGYDTFWKHMNTLLSAGVVNEQSEGSKTLYQINAKGLQLLGDFSPE